MSVDCGKLLAYLTLVQMRHGPPPRLTRENFEAKLFQSRNFTIKLRWAVEEQMSATAYLSHRIAAKLKP